MLTSQPAWRHWALDFRAELNSGMYCQERSPPNHLFITLESGMCDVVEIILLLKG